MNEEEKKANAANDPIQNLETWVQYIYQFKIQYIIPNTFTNKESIAHKDSLHNQLNKIISYPSVVWGVVINHFQTSSGCWWATLTGESCCPTWQWSSRCWWLCGFMAGYLVGWLVLVDGGRETRLKAHVLKRLAWFFTLPLAPNMGEIEARTGHGFASIECRMSCTNSYGLVV